MRAQRLGRSSSAVFGLVVGMAMMMGCGEGPPQIVISSPVNGTFTTASSVVVTGALLYVDAEDIADVTINGVSVLPLGPGQTFSTTVNLDPSAIINPIVAEVVAHGGSTLRDRVSVMRGDTVADGAFSQEGIALRINESGLDAIEPLVTSLVPLDLASLVPPGTLVVDNYCYQDSIFGCLGRVDATISGSPPPSLGSFGIDIDPMTNFVAGDITLFNLFFRANVVAVTGIGFSCTIDITASTTLIAGDYGMQPNATFPDEVDVVQIGNVAIAFGNFNDSTNCSGFLGGIVEFFIGIFVSDLQNDLVRPGLENFLNAVDGNGNTATASALESALAAIEITGPIGEAIGVNLEAPMFDITEDTNGITLGSDARITASLPLPEAPDLTESYSITQPFPTFGPLSPNNIPYDLGICISASAFNQLLKAEIESGLLITSISEFDFGTGLQPLTAGLLAAILPPFGLLDPLEPLRIDLAPTAAPILSGQIGPAGELATLEMPHLVVSIVPVVEPETLLLQGVVDAELGLDADFIGGELAFLLSAPQAENISITLLENPFRVSEATLDALLPGLLALAVPTLSDSLGTFPLPDFLGLQLGLVDVDRNGEFMSLFFDLTPAP